MLCEDGTELEPTVCRCRNCVLRKPEDLPWPEALEQEAQAQAEQQQARTKRNKAQKKAQLQQAQAQQAQPQQEQETPTKMDRRNVKNMTKRDSVRTIDSLHSNATMLEADRQYDLRNNSSTVSANASVIEEAAAAQRQQQPQQPTILLIVVNKPPEQQLYPPPGAGYGAGPSRGPPNYYNSPPGPERRGFGPGRGPPGYGPGRGPPGYGAGRGGPGYEPGPNYGQYPGYGPGPNYAQDRRRNDARSYPQWRRDPRDARESFQSEGRYRQPPSSQGWRGEPPPQGGKYNGAPQRSNEGEQEGNDRDRSKCHCEPNDGRSRGKAGNEENPGNYRNQNKKQCMCVSEDERYMQSNPPRHRNCHCGEVVQAGSAGKLREMKQENERSDPRNIPSGMRYEPSGTRSEPSGTRSDHRRATKYTDESTPESLAMSAPAENPSLPFSKETTCSHQKEEVIIPGKKTYRYVTVPVCITHGNAKSCVCCDCEADDDDDEDEDEYDRERRKCDCNPQGHCSCMDGQGGSQMHNELLCECDMTNLERTLQHLIPNTDCMCYFKAKKKRRKRKPVPIVRYDRFANPPFVLNPRPRCLEYSCNTCCCPVGRSCYSCDYSHPWCRPRCW
ncbi:uncharacterized protein CG42266 [Drosophila subobscura]|uniref:uncharacterized protein CG42266 n=1 Tax=Drosophila subobscura TaxID=7241 RepID=UPI00155A5FB5|nr:uncharacterized protein CG42266 [Drosophila subobscura]